MKQCPSVWAGATSHECETQLCNPIKGFKRSASSSAYAELHCPCPCHPCCLPNNGCEILNDSCGQEAIASTQSQSMSRSPTTRRICHLHFLDFSPCSREPLDLMTFFFLITNVTKLRSGELSSASRPYGKSPNIETVCDKVCRIVKLSGSEIKK